MNSATQRQQIINNIKIAVQSGARLSRACLCIGLTERTFQRWQHNDAQIDRRTNRIQTKPAHALSDEEKAHILLTCNLPEYASLPPAQIIPKLADKGVYIASESSFYRVLKAHGQLNHRGRAAAAKTQKPPTTHIARDINQVWTWDITYLPSTVRGQFFYLYCIQDLYSRKIIAWEVHQRESGEQAARLLTQAKWRAGDTSKLILHSDNGAAMKSQVLRVKLQELGIASSYSRPRVSNDNAYIESLFRTLKYTPKWPSSGFSNIDQAREWVLAFVTWYNTMHQHSSLNFVTPEQRHLGLDPQILAKRRELYDKAKAKHPQRWSGKTRNWLPSPAVALNPCNEEKTTANLSKAA